MPLYLSFILLCLCNTVNAQQVKSEIHIEKNEDNKILGRHEIYYDDKGLIIKEFYEYENFGSLKLTTKISKNHFIDSFFQPQYDSLSVLEFTNLMHIFIDDFNNETERLEIDNRKNDSLSYKTEYVYNALNKVASTKESLNNLAKFNRKFVYNENGKISSVISTSLTKESPSEIESYWYDSNGNNNLMSIFDKDGTTGFKEYTFFEKDLPITKRVEKFINGEVDNTQFIEYTYNELKKVVKVVTISDTKLIDEISYTFY